mgnify:CR=1 FL=1
MFERVSKKNIWEAIGKISTHYNRMRLLNEISQDKNKIISEHTKYLTTIKNKEQIFIENENGDILGTFNKNVIGTYLHGIFDDNNFLNSFINKSLIFIQLSKFKVNTLITKFYCFIIKFYCRI